MRAAWGLRARRKAHACACALIARDPTVIARVQEIKSLHVQLAEANESHEVEARHQTSRILALQCVRVCM